MHFRLEPLDDRYPRYLLDNQPRFRHLIGQHTARIASLYEQALARPSDIQGHLAYLYRLASTVEHVTEFGTRSGQSAAAFLHARPRRLVCYDTERSEAVALLEAAAQGEGVDFVFRQEDVLAVEIEPTDLLFIDTWHVEAQMREELSRHADRVRRYLVFHDTETFGQEGETPGHPGIWPAIAGFMRAHPQWRLLQHFPHHHGLTVFARV